MNYVKWTKCEISCLNFVKCSLSLSIFKLIYRIKILTSPFRFVTESCLPFSWCAFKCVFKERVFDARRFHSRIVKLWKDLGEVRIRQNVVVAVVVVNVLLDRKQVPEPDGSGWGAGVNGGNADKVIRRLILPLVVILNDPEQSVHFLRTVFIQVTGQEKLAFIKDFLSPFAL